MPKKSIFYDKDNDPMGKQASDLLSARLAASDKFLLIERQDYDKIVEELNTGNRLSNSIGADYLIIGSITGIRPQDGRHAKVVLKQQRTDCGSDRQHPARGCGDRHDCLQRRGARTGIHGRQTGVGAREHCRLRCHMSDKAISAAISKTGGKHHQQMWTIRGPTCSAMTTASISCRAVRVRE